MILADLIVARAVYQLSLAEYSVIRQAYAADVEQILFDYLSSNKKVTGFKNRMKRAILDSFYPAFEMGLADGGAEPPAQGDDLDWINARVAEEFGHLDSLFVNARELRGEGVDEWQGWPAERAEGYARSLDAVYKEGKMRGAKNKMLTFGGSDGKESCRTCQKLKDKRHRASWWVKRGLVPGQPGNGNYECGGWQCEHYLYDDDGKLFVA